jgi:peptidoglycan/LPS O-acetylase OafA/YrhL
VRAFFQNGYQAVSFFFLLSGFILAYVYFDPQAATGLKGGKKGFWVARIARIYPIYIVSLIIALPAFAYSAFVSKLISSDQFAIAAATAPIMAQAWFPSATLVWNAPAWSISVEALCYLCFPLIARFLLPRASLFATIGVGVGAATITGARAVLLEQLSRNGNAPFAQNLLNYWPLFHLPTFVFGSMLGWIVLSQQRIAPSLAEGFLCSGLILLTIIFAYHKSSDGVSLADALLLAVYAAIIIGGTYSTRFVGKLLSHRVLVYLGDASYAIYILHLPLKFWWTKLRWTSIAPISSSVDSALFIVFVVAFASIAHSFFEIPLRKWVSVRLLGLRQPQTTEGPNLAAPPLS